MEEFEEAVATEEHDVPLKEAPSPESGAPPPVEGSLPRLVPDLSGKTIAIVGHGVSLKDAMSEALSLGSVSCLGDEVWAVDGMGGTIFNHRAFMLRPLDGAIDTPALLWVRNATTPVYSSKEQEGFPNVIRYPIEEVVAHMGLPYLNSSAACALAFAICGGAKRIKLYGLDAIGRERGCLEFLLAKAIHSTLSVEVSPSSVLFDNDLSPAEKLVGFSMLQDPLCSVVIDGRLTILTRSEIKARQAK